MGGKPRGWVDCSRGSGKRCLALEEVGKRLGLLRRVECWAFWDNGRESKKEFLKNEGENEQRMGKKGCN